MYFIWSFCDRHRFVHRWEVECAFLKFLQMGIWIVQCGFGFKLSQMGEDQSVSFCTDSQLDLGWDFG